MNKKLLFTDLFALAFGVVAFSVVQLIKDYASALLANPVLIISFTIGLILFGAFVMQFSYKNNSDTVTISNFTEQLIIAVIIAVLLILFAKGVITFTTLNLSVCIAFLALFASRFMFSLSIYAKEHKTQKPLRKPSGFYVEKGYSKNMSDEPHENFETAGYIILVLGTLALIAVAIDSFYPFLIFS